MTATTPDIRLGVSLFSYGGDFLVTMSLEDCLADIADMGASGVEILADTHIPGYPYPTEDWVQDWHRMVGQYGLTPTCLSTWLDTRLHAEKPLSAEEGVTMMSRDLELAHRLGFTLLRPKLGVVSLDLIPDPVWRDVIRQVLPQARGYGIRIVPEIHAPTPLKSTIVNDYLALAQETGGEQFGLLIDTGIFQDRWREGQHADSVYIFGNPDPELAAEVGRTMSQPMNGDPAELLDVMTHIFHIHAKFWAMTEDLTDPQTTWDGIIAALVRGGYRGYLSSEYEGRRDLYRASDMVRRQQVMLRRLLAENGVQVG